MKREILFRGKLSHVNIWVEGNLIIANNGSQYIIPSNVFEPDGHHLIIDSDEPWRIDENTVCQFTGITDKNGTKIFEGGIVRFYDDSEDELVNGAIVYNADFCSFCVSIKGHEDIMLMAHWQYELIGNIHDNPELLKP